MKVKPIRNWVKLEVRSNKKTTSGIIIKSAEGEFQEVYVEDYGQQAKELIPELTIGQRVDLIPHVTINIFKEGNKEYCLVDSGTIIGVYS